MRADKAAGLTLTIQFDLSGDGGGTWWARVKDGICTVGTGPATSRPDLTLVADASDYVDIRLGRLDPFEAFKAGKVRLKGKGSLPQSFRLLSVFSRPD